MPIVPRAGRIRFEELTQDLKNDYAINGKRSTSDLERRIDKHLVPYFGQRRVATITTSDIRAFVAERQEALASNGEINRELAALRRGFVLAMQAGKLMSRPYVPTLAEAAPRSGFFEREQFEAVRSRLPEELRPLVTFLFITGWRWKSEVAKLQWRNVSFNSSEVRLDAGSTKNGDGRVFPFTAELRALLESQRDATRQLEREQGAIISWVFHRQGRPIRSFRGTWAKACKDAGCPGRVAHDFRRTAVRNLVRAGVTESVAMKLTGHKTRTVFERYNIVSKGDFEDAARRLNTFAGTITGTTP